MILIVWVDVVVVWWRLNFILWIWKDYIYYESCFFLIFGFDFNLLICCDSFFLMSGSGYVFLSVILLSVLLLNVILKILVLNVIFKY